MYKYPAPKKQNGSQLHILADKKGRAISSTVTAVAVIVIILAAVAGAYIYSTYAPSPTVTTPGSTVGPTTTAQSPSYIKIGYVDELTGAAAVQGNAYLQGMETWATQVNNHGGLYVADVGKNLSVQLVGYDDQTSATLAVTLAQKLVSDGVNVVGPSTFVDAQVAIAPVFAKAGIPVLMGALPDSANSSFGSYLWKMAFPTWQYYSAQPAGFFEYLAQETVFPKPSTVAVACTNTAFGQAFCSKIGNYSKAAGITMVTQQFYTGQQSSYVDLVAKLQATNPDFVLISSNFPADAITIAKEMSSLNFKPKLEVINLIGYPGFIASLGPLANGVMGDSFWNSDMTTPGNPAFIKLYTTLYGKAPVYGNAIGFAAMELYQAAVAKAGSIDPAKVAAALSSLTAQTVAGTWSPGHPLGFVIVQAINGTLSTVYPFSAATAKGELTNP